MPMNALNIGEIFYKDNETGELKKLGRPINYSLTCEAGCIPILTTDIGLTNFGEKVIMPDETSCISVADIQPIFEVGDVVEIKSWDEMKKEFGLNGCGSINCRESFVVSMQHLCGKIFKIAEVQKDCVVRLEDCDDNWVISTDMIKHVNKKKNDNLDIGNLYPTYMSIDIGDMKVDFEKLLEERIEKKKKEKERGKDMELLKMYEEYAREIIENAMNEEIESRLNANPTIRAFKELEEGFKKRCEDLFATQMRSLNLEDVAISEHHSGYMFKYGIASSYKQKVEEDVRNKYSHYMTDLYDRLSEVEAHLKLINANSTENDYANKLCVLYSYGIIDGNNHLVKYTIPTEENINEDFCRCALEDEVTEQPKKKRGRKPENLKEQ